MSGCKVHEFVTPRERSSVVSYTMLSFHTASIVARGSASQTVFARTSAAPVMKVTLLIIGSVGLLPIASRRGPYTVPSLVLGFEV